LKKSSGIKELEQFLNLFVRIILSGREGEVSKKMLIRTLSRESRGNVY
jgi:hypothetical protein